MARIYNDSARDRVRKAVIYTERRRTEPQWPRPSRRFTGDQMFTAILSGDLEHKKIGKAKVAKGATFEVGAFTAEREVDVWNPGRKLWNGAEIQCLASSLAQPSYGSDGRKFTVVEAWSATIVKGKAASTINAGSSGTLNTLEPIDGVYQPSTLTAELPAGSEDVASGASVFAQLTWRASGSVWIIREGAASGPGGGAGTVHPQIDYFTTDSFDGSTSKIIQSGQTSFPYYSSNTQDNWKTLTGDPYSYSPDGNFEALVAGGYLVYAKLKFQLVKHSEVSDDAGVVDIKLGYSIASAILPAAAFLVPFDFNNVPDSDEQFVVETLLPPLSVSVGSRFSMSVYYKHVFQTDERVDLKLILFNTTLMRITA